MVWKYVTGDKYNLDDLHEYLEFFESDLLSAKKSLDKAQRYAVYGLPNWRSEIIKYQVGVEEAQKNVDICKRAIAEYIP